MNPIVDYTSEYIPYPDPAWTTSSMPKPKGQKFPAFPFEEVISLVDESFKTKTVQEHTGLAWTYYGGVAIL